MVTKFSLSVSVGYSLPAPLAFIFREAWIDHYVTNMLAADLAAFNDVLRCELLLHSHSEFPLEGRPFLSDINLVPEIFSSDGNFESKPVTADDDSPNSITATIGVAAECGANQFRGFPKVTRQDSDFHDNSTPSTSKPLL